ncbi:WD40 repeat-like protein [Pleomassaria siparia CBS 279.74]|uniref:WD40 repeat-like protein n=1 Tax=Pleomassaria siparia CBS 279.74 TaxID=1314801 RepID=A0A6G1KAY9_9PLEO|nr:WD40 repeat-like protein [Pleomassaria siparia CBS 279.74]
MKYTVYDRLLQRELGDRKRYSSPRGIYGDRQWVENLDIVNELEGHNGCVNALSWSRSGRLLASGSDDHRINIHSYHPESSTSQFSLTTSIMTGHRTNIFSVKFMPYSNDRTIVSATDDVRIFDIEHSGHSALGASSTGSRLGSGSHNSNNTGVQRGLRLTELDTNAKAFRSHSDTVKRIVTEDNPFYFLTCSEDGDVRQWDVRQPSKTYPSAGASDDVPPPLISYSRYNLDLNTISCSPSQPHYIALGGAHLHCFLHDRRMLGRDQFSERGAKLSSSSTLSDHDDELLGKATQCVKKFAPNGQKRMSRTDNGHITACKISDANPNELVVSWSGDWIYSFDMMRSPGATEEIVPSKVASGDTSHRVKDGRKRKRTKSTILSQESVERASSRQRTSTQASNSDTHEGLSLRVNYGNGQSEEIRIQSPQTATTESPVATHSDTEHFRIAKTTIKILRDMVDLKSSNPAAVIDGPDGHTANFTSVVGFAVSILPEMDDISRAWRYPVDPTELDVARQITMRDMRATSRRFVQAAGTLARVLGGQLRSAGNSNAIISRYLATIGPAPNERAAPLPRHEAFGYDFLKAILLWLDSGLGALIEGFSSLSSNPRLPISPDADVDAIDDVLIPYLLQLASGDPIVDVDVSKFETDDTRILYSSERAAVLEFAHDVKTPFADLTGAVVPEAGSSSEEPDIQDRKTAIRKWAFKVGRGILLNAAKDVKFTSVDRAFGGQGISNASIRAEERALRERQEDIDPLEDDADLFDAALINSVWAQQQLAERSPGSPSLHEATESSTRRGSASPLLSGDEALEEAEEDGEDSDGDIDPLDADDDDDDDDEDVDSDGLARTRSGRVLWRSDFDRSYTRERVESDIPCSPHTRRYVGHCNVRTVKDVNFFGLDDEYVVSGSDSGHVFIWDRKTSQLLNILEGDGEVVNVVQGHPYEPTMAVSGIDHTIKIFSPDTLDQHNARRGIGVHRADPGLSSLGYRRRQISLASASASTSAVDPSVSDEEEDEKVAPMGLSSRKRMHQEYQIVAKNDVDRKGGRDDAFITRALLAQLAQRIHRQNAGENDGEEEDGEDTILLNNDDNCTVM